MRSPTSSILLLPLVPKSVTLNDLELRSPNMPNGCVISSTLVDFWANNVKVDEDTRIRSRQKCRPKNVVFNATSLMAILVGDQP